LRVPTQLLKCVAFISRDEEQLDYGGSAFIVLVPHDDTSGCLHLITAKHVAIALTEGKATVAMNGKDGLPLWMKNTTAVGWFFHPDEAVDVAVLPMASIRLNEYDYQEIPTTIFVTAERAAVFGISVGDETISLGLFRPFVGRSRFTPIARSGIIAMMPDGELPHPKFLTMEAYLIESRSKGGLSGSPVFVRNTIHPQGIDSAGTPVRFSASSDFHLLGLLSGHWTTDPTSSKEGDNMGLSLVVPAAKILETLFHPDLLVLRKEAFERGFTSDTDSNNPSANN
jgi:hypothetical protein